MPLVSDRRLSKRFSDTASPGESGELTETVERDATVESVSVRLYSGAELDLELWPFREDQSGGRVGLVDLVGRDVIVGDDDVWDFYISEPVSEGEVIGVEYEHTDASSSADLNFHVDVGDDDVWEFHISEPVNEGEVIGVEYEHTDASSSADLNFHVDVGVDRAGGLERLLGGEF